MDLAILIHGSPILRLVLYFSVVVVSSDVNIVVVLIIELGQNEILCQNLSFFDIDHCDLIYYVLLFGFRRLVADTIDFLLMMLNVDHETSS